MTNKQQSQDAGAEGAFGMMRNAGLLGQKMLVSQGELSSARQALEGAQLAPGDLSTLNALRNPVRRPPQLREPVPEELLTFQPQVKFQLDRDLFCRNLRSARKGAAGGLSVMTTEHLRPLLEDVRGLRLLGEVAERLVRAEVPPEVMRLVRGGRLTALAKLDGGVRGMVVGDVIRRLVARTMSQELSKAADAATAPHQYALSTRAGCECVAHALQGLVELDQDSTIVSIEGISAYDLISRESMMTGLFRMEGGSAEYLWEDNQGNVHVVPQGEGGEQGDAMMPLLFCLWQQEALQAVQRQLEDGERLFAFLDDDHVVTRPLQDFGGSLEGFLVHPHPQRQKEDMGRVRNASRGMRLVGADSTRREPQSHSVEGRWGAHRPARHQGVGHSTWARRFRRQSPPRSRARPTRASEKDPDGERSAVPRQGPTTSSDLSDLQPQNNSQEPTTKVFCNVWPPSLAQIWVNAQKRCASW